VHTTGGYLAFVQMTARLTFNLIPDAGQLFWCSADIGWITGHSYVLYGPDEPRAHAHVRGRAQLPHAGGRAGDRFWDIIARHKVTQFYTAPTAIRTFMKWGDDLPAGTTSRASSCSAPWASPSTPRRGCGTTSTSAREVPDRGHLLADRDRRARGHAAARRDPHQARVVHAADAGDRRGDRERAGRGTGPNKGGLFVIRKPWPGMLRGVYGNRERFVSNYWGRVKEPEDGEPYYFSADGARRDEDGYFWIQGRIDDVIKVSGTCWARWRSRARW
jgi:acetyl-CoA synthetase